MTPAPGRSGSSSLPDVSAYARETWAWLMLQRRARTLTDDALFFHATSVRPGWSSRFVRTAMIGRQVFYRPEVRLSQT